MRRPGGSRDSLCRSTKYEGILVLLFILTLPLSNPWVRGDGVGYYAFARSLLIEHRLDFTEDWQRANTSFRMGRCDADGRPLPDQYTATGHLDNHFSVGPAILWAPFLIVAHVSVVICDLLGGRIPADGFSKPYLVAMALGTALYGFLALMISFTLARRYVAERWAFLATLGIWSGSALPVYMYFNPSWSHAQSGFMVALFVWYWAITRRARTWTQWAILGAIVGLMVDVYYLSGVLLLLPLLESLASYGRVFAGTADESIGRLISENIIFGTAVLIAFLPTLIKKRSSKRLHHGENTRSVATGWLRAVGKHWAVTLCGDNIVRLRLFRQKTFEFLVLYFFDHVICVAQGEKACSATR